MFQKSKYLKLIFYLHFQLNYRFEDEVIPVLIQCVAEDGEGNFNFNSEYKSIKIHLSY